MSPLSPQKRTVYFLFFTVVFLLSIPIIVLYATGYRFTDGFDLAPRGGVYVSVSRSNATIAIDGVHYATSTYFNRDYFKQDMTSGTHSVRVAHPRHRPWHKEVVVESKKVTPVYPFLMPTEFVLRPVTPPREPATTTSATATPVREDQRRYASVLELFAPAATSTATDAGEGKPRIPSLATTATITPATATPAIVPATHKVTNNDVTLWHTDRVVYAYRRSDDGWLPRRFCNPYTCSNPMEVVHTDSAVTNVEFYPGRDDVILYTTSDGLYVAEIDKRPRQINERIIEGTDVAFRVHHGTLYIKRGDYLAEVELE